MSEPSVVMDRLRRSADKARGVGMRVSVSGADLAAMFDEFDRLRAVETEAAGQQTSRPKSTGKPKVSRSAPKAVIAAADDILDNHAVLWGQPLRSALPSWCEQTGTVLPKGWESLVDDG